MKVAVLLLALAASSFAGEFAVLATGFRLHADRHEVDGATVKLYQKNGGFTQMAASLVTAFEPEVELPAASSTPAANPVVAPRPPRELVEAAARKYGLPPKFVHSVVAAESGYKTKAVSPKGAIGLMQLMPGTAAGLNVVYQQLLPALLVTGAAPAAGVNAATVAGVR